ncbi:MAG: hypothetical protein AW08_00030 [Candidatus Accumulibacter adjunctus]|uniref:Uncharacterized protein n=1 Tax=Candidatus Accumulibacter adjunctus TaxID=1454001 RepID=A0A011NY20_9PROT|nr:MAG: hypothetical protein AW08_00030 [Candidatus Accumulibacter adjunctus]
MQRSARADVHSSDPVARRRSVIVSLLSCLRSASCLQASLAVAALPQPTAKQDAYLIATADTQAQLVSRQDRPRRDRAVAVNPRANHRSPALLDRSNDRRGLTTANLPLQPGCRCRQRSSRSGRQPMPSPGAPWRVDAPSLCRHACNQEGPGDCWRKLPATMSAAAAGRLPATRRATDDSRGGAASRLAGPTNGKCTRRRDRCSHESC